MLVANHGAAVSERYADADGEIARRIRQTVGACVPVGMALDLHANMTEQVVEYTTVITVYQTNPHIDAKLRAFECASLIHRTVLGEIAPVQWLESPPLVINITRQSTAEEPMLSLLAAARDAEQEPSILSTSVVQGYPYADVPEMGMSFLAVSDGDQSAARAAAVRMAREAWNARASMRGQMTSVDDALQRAVRAPSGPVVLMDVGDNILAGSAADSTIILAAARRLGIRGLLQTVYDPAAVTACVAAGVGATLTVEVGAHTDTLHGEPLLLTGQVTTIAVGDYEDPGPTHGGFRYFDDGLRAVLRTDCGHTLLLTSNRSSNLSRRQMYTVGLRPESFRIVVAKGVVSPQPAYAPIATEIILVNTAGLTSADLSSFAYQRRRRPLYPLEVDAHYVEDSLD